VDRQNPAANAAGAAKQESHSARAAKEYRWVLQENSIRLLPPVPKRSFKWSYLLARTLRRLNPGNFL
jgi:hypothetical protein